MRRSIAEQEYKRGPMCVSAGVLEVCSGCFGKGALPRNVFAPETITPHCNRICYSRSEADLREDYLANSNKYAV